MRITLRKALDEETDFVTVNSEIWEALHFWYGGGPSIPRFFKARTDCCEKYDTYIDIYAKSPPTLNEAKAMHGKSINAVASDAIQAALEVVDDIVLSATSMALTGVETETMKSSSDITSVSGGRNVKLVTTCIVSDDEAEKVLSASNAALLVRSKSTDFNYCGASEALQRAIQASAKTRTLEDGADIGTELAAVLDNMASLSEDCIDQSLMMVASRYCFVCRREAIERCSKCRAVYYCDKDCQKSDWKCHKNWCAAAKAHSHLPSKQFEAKVSVGRRGRVGIMNLGNSCYLSSCLQCLSHIFPLTSHFLSGRFEKHLNRESRDGTGGILTAEYDNLLKDLWFESKAAVSPSAFKKVLGTIRSEYKGLQQQDAHELVELVLEKLHEDLNKVRKKPYTERPEGDGSNDSVTAAEAWRIHSLREDSFVRDIVGSQMRSQIICPDCGKIAVFFEYQQTLQIAIPRNIVVPCRVLKVYFVPQRSDLVKDLRNAAMHAAGANIPGTAASSSPGPLFIPSFDDVTRALRPVLFDITVDATSTCRQIKEEVMKRLVRIALPCVPVDSGRCAIYELESLMALELGEGESSLSALVDDDASVSAYAESGISILMCSQKNRKLNVFLLQRVRFPNGSVKCVGIPSLIQVDATFTFPRLRFAVWQQLSHLLTACPTSSAAEGSGENGDTGRLISPPNPLSQAARQAEKTGDVNTQLAISCVLPLHLVSKSGDPEYVEKMSALRAAMDAEAQVAMTTALKQLEAVCGVAHRQSLSEPITQAVDWISVDDEKKRARSEKLEVVYGSSIPVSGPMKVGDAAPKNYLFLSVDSTDPWRQAVSAVGEHDKFTFDESSASLLQERSKSSGALTLAQCLSEHTREELLDQDNAWYCSNCKDHKCARKVVKFWRGNLPSVLVLVLKRFETLDGGVMGSSVHREKINSLVDFPLDGLDLSQFCASGGRETDACPDTANIEEGDNASSVYDLLAVCNHYGRLGSGHYTAYARDWLSDGRLANTWYSYDDDDVTACADGAEVVSRAAYILFYKRRQQG